MAFNYTDREAVLTHKLFFPGFLAIVVETLVAVMLLVVFNLSLIEASLFGDTDRSFRFTLFAGSLLAKLVTLVSSQEFLSLAIIYLIWALVGILIYILCFRLLQVLFSMFSSLTIGFRYVKIDKTKGFVEWLVSLHDFFIEIVIHVVGFTIFCVGIFIGLVVSTDELELALYSNSPSDLIHYTFCIIAVIIGARLTVIGFCVLLPRFARWYLI